LPPRHAFANEGFVNAKPETHRLRLDELLVARGEFASRSRARDAIARGAVSVEGRVVTKAGQQVAESAAIQVEDPARRYVSRSALKLVAALDHFGLDPGGSLALDIGASTGGFTQVLL
jgi:23S rRNA (cytidine1920-2'-O)/16S rRNA (cytidine1409-2'-O)-methyltransferase